MTTLSRKQQEIAQREEDILTLSRNILLQEGYRDLTIDRLASDLGVSKGTVYNHFANKDDIVMALATRALQTRLALFATASTFAVPTRHRLMAIGAAAEHFCDNFQEHFQIELWIRNHHIWERSSGNFQSVIRQCEQSTMGLVAGIIGAAVERKELGVAEVSPEEIVFGFWALVHGGQVLAATSPSIKEIGISDTHRTIRRHCYYLMEGLGWTPIQTFETQSGLMDEYRTRLTNFKV